MANDPVIKKAGSNAWPWALVTGLAVGLLVGREMGPRRGGSEGMAGEGRAAPAAGAAAPGVAKAYASESEFPAGWMKSTELTGVPGVSFDGMSETQKTAAMQALNERDCDCGCGMGHIAGCAKKDPNCPRSPRIAKQVVDMAKQGKPLSELLAYVDRENPKPGAAPAAGAAAPAPSGPRKIPLSADSPRLGPKASKVNIVIFSDFQCPFCKRAVPVMKEIEQKYPKDVAFVFRNQPLPFHDKATGAAKALLAAHRQGKAWPMHDKMFENNTALEPENLEKYAKELGLNGARFKKDMDDPAIAKQVADDQALANSVGANGTPTFFINGRELVGAQPFDSFKTIIDEEIKKADNLLKAGTKLEQVYDKLMEQAAAAAPAAPAGGGAAAPGRKVDVSPGDSPSKGPKNAKVTVVAFSDFQCPFCSRVVPTLKQLEDSYKGKLRVVFKNLPLPFHDKAKLAAEASLAAHEQGRFWDYHDKLFANQSALDRADLERYAQELGLDMGKFKKGLDSGKFRASIDADQKQAASIGATGTPTFYVNGHELVGAQPYDAFKKAVDEALTH